VALAGRGASRSGSGSVTTMHALFKRQVECKVTPVTGLFSLRIPEFESDRPGILNRPAVMLRHPPCRQRQRKCLPQLHVRHTAARTRTVSAAPFRPELPAATPADFDPNGFLSSSPTTPATQSGLGAVISRHENFSDFSLPPWGSRPATRASGNGQPFDHRSSRGLSFSLAVSPAKPTSKGAAIP
jgi:hypothetical protein